MSFGRCACNECRNVEQPCQPAQYWAAGFRRHYRVLPKQRRTGLRRNRYRQNGRSGRSGRFVRGFMDTQAIERQKSSDYSRRNVWSHRSCPRHYQYFQRTNGHGFSTCVPCCRSESHADLRSNSDGLASRLGSFRTSCQRRSHVSGSSPPYPWARCLYFRCSRCRL